MAKMHRTVRWLYRFSSWLIDSYVNDGCDVPCSIMEKVAAMNDAIRNEYFKESDE